MLRPMMATNALFVAVTAFAVSAAVSPSDAQRLPHRHMLILTDDAEGDEDAPSSAERDDDSAYGGGGSEPAPVQPPDVIEPPGCPLNSAPLELIV